MSNDELDISGALAWGDGLPHLQWDDVVAYVESTRETGARQGAWDTVLRQWMGELGAALGGEYEIVESDHFLVLTAEPDAVGRSVARTAERCRVALLSGLPGVASPADDGKDVLIVVRTRDDYYRYIAHYYPEGMFGQSAGMHIRDGLSHVVLYGTELWMVEPTVAHELTHVFLSDLTMPQWLEEGLAQLFERDVTGYSEFLLDAEMAKQHRRFWGRCGLDACWGGRAFSHRGLAQRLSYQLAEILVRLLLETPRERLFAFLRGASGSDGGEVACRENLEFTLGDLAARFLGPGTWTPDPG